MTRAVLFDLDGTLLDSLEDLADSANYALRQRGYPVHALEAYKYFVGNGMAKLIERILPAERRDVPEERERLAAIYAPYYAAHSLDKTKPYDGIEEMLQALRERGIKTAVVSNKPDEPARQTVGAVFPAGTFDVVVGGLPAFPLKPAPDLALHVLGRLGVAPGEALFVGDTGTDMRTAKSAGCTAVGVTWGFRGREELLENGADRLIDRPRELFDLL